MSSGWLDIEGPSGSRRAPLKEGLTRVGGAGADIRLGGPEGGPGGDELHVWDRPPRMLFLGGGARPTCAGQSFDERGLRPGERVQWCGHALMYGAEALYEGEAAHPDEAVLEELPPPAPTPVGSAASAVLGERVRAGLACELGLADDWAVKRWRASARGGSFDPDACARELLPVPLSAEDERRLLERAAALERDLLLGAAGVRAAATRRKTHAASPGLLAFLLIQLVSFLVFAALVAAILYVLRIRGTSIDEYLDRFMLERFRRG